MYWLFSTGRLRRLMTRKNALKDGVMVDDHQDAVNRSYGNNGGIRSGKWRKAGDANGRAFSETGSTISALTGYNSTLKDEGGSCGENSEGWSTIDSRSDCASRKGGASGSGPASAVEGYSEPNLRNNVDDEDPRR